MLQNDAPVVHRKPSSSRSERRASVSRVKAANGVPPPPGKEEEGGGGGASNGELRGVLEIEPAGKDKDAGPASSLLGRRQSSSKAGGDAYRVLYVCACAAAFVNAMTFSVLGPFLPAYISGRFGSTVTQVGMIMAAYPAVNLATSPLVGWIMNRYGRWKSLFAGLVILAASTALYGLASSVTGLYVASGLHGASLSFIHVSSLGLLSVFPDRLTESMAGIEIWSGVAAILGPPLGCLVVPYGGVSSVFFMVAMFPVCLLLLTPRIGRLVRPGKGDGGDYGEVGQPSAGGGSSSVWKVARNRGVLTGAFVTVYNYGVMGFLEVTLAPHLAQTLSTSPRSIGFVLVLPNVLYTVTAMKAEDIVDRHGVRRTLLGGLCIMSVSLLLYGPSPALAPALVTRGAARGVIGLGLLAFQVGSSLASVPAFTAMQGGVAGMGPGADDMVASAHAMSIGVGEIIGPIVGGYFVELLPSSQAFACEPDSPIVELHDPIFQLAGELRPHPDHPLDGHDTSAPLPGPQEGGPSPPREDTPAEALDARGTPEGRVVAPGMWAGGEHGHRLLGEETQQRIGGGLAEGRRREARGVAAAGMGKSGSVTLWPLGAGFLALGGEGEEEGGVEEHTIGPVFSEGKPGVALAGGGEEGARDRGEDGEREGHRVRRLLGRRKRKARPRQAKRRQQRQRQQGLGPGTAAGAMTEPPALVAALGVSDGDDDIVTAPGWAAAAPAVVAGSGEKAIDPPSPKDGEDVAAGGPWEWKLDSDAGGSADGVPGAVVGPGHASGGGGGEGGGGDGQNSCDSSFPLATTLLAWASVLAIAAMYRWLPQQPGASKGHAAGLPS
eukprot:g5008.t1